MQEREERFNASQFRVLGRDNDRPLGQALAVADEVAQLDVAQVGVGEGGGELFDVAEVALDRVSAQVPRFEVFFVELKHRRGDGFCGGCVSTRL